MATMTRSQQRASQERMGPTTVTAPEFPAELVGKKVLLASESLGPVNGVSRTTQSLVDYLRVHGVQVWEFVGFICRDLAEPQTRLRLVRQNM